MKENISSLLPLSPATLHILLSLAGEELHGYGIMQEVQRQSGGKYKLGPGTLYDNLQKMIERGLVEELGKRPGDDDPRRRYYRLSSLGRGVLSTEIARLDDVVREGKLRLQAKPRRAGCWASFIAACCAPTRLGSASALPMRCCPFSIRPLARSRRPRCWWMAL